MDAGLARGGDRPARARVEERVLADQRPIEVAGKRLDLGREVRRKSQVPVVRNLTSASTWSFGRLAKLGMTGGKPFSTYAFGSTIDVCTN